MKIIRLPEEIYKRANLQCSITICTSGNIRIFENKDFSHYCMRLLEDLCKSYSIKLFAYCFMPNHLHFVVSVQDGKSIIDLIASFKSLSTKESWKLELEGKLYQRRFYDRFIRKDEDLRQAVLHILNNSVRKNIVQKWEDYPYSKCFL